MTTVRIGDSSLLDKKRRVHSSAGCFLVRKSATGTFELLVIHKTWPDGEEKFVLPKGHQQGDETLEETATRETVEEAGYVDFTLLAYVGSCTYELDWDEIFIKTDHYYIAELRSEKRDKQKQEKYEEGVLVETLWVDIEKGIGLLKYENLPELRIQVKRLLEL